MGEASSLPSVTLNGVCVREVGERAAPGRPQGRGSSCCCDPCPEAAVHLLPPQLGGGGAPTSLILGHRPPVSPPDSQESESVGRCGPRTLFLKAPGCLPVCSQASGREALGSGLCVAP